LIDLWMGRKFRTVLRRLIEQRAEPFSPADLRRPAIVFAPHQDDETLGCGGTIALRWEAGADVQVVFLTDGRASHSQYLTAEDLVEMRQREAVRACSQLGLEERTIHFLGFPDGSLRECRAQAQQHVSQLLRQHQPADIFLPYRADPPPDHMAAYQIVKSAAQDCQFDGFLYEYPVWFWFHWPWIDSFTKTPGQKKRLAANTIRAGFGLRLLSDFRYATAVENVLAVKKTALGQYRSQMEELIPDAGWPTLPGVADGNFLTCFFQKQEIFRRTSMRSISAT
jgi:LmbE family N-acetylglucosaminyl deacetylase